LIFGGFINYLFYANENARGIFIRQGAMQFHYFKDNYICAYYIIEIDLFYANENARGIFIRQGAMQFHYFKR